MRYFIRETLRAEGSKKVTSRRQSLVSDEVARNLGLTVLQAPTGDYPFLSGKVSGIGKDIVTKHVFVQFPCQAGQKEVRGTFIRDEAGAYVTEGRKAQMTSIDLSALEECRGSVIKDTGDLAGPGVLCEECLKKLRGLRRAGKNDGAVGLSAEQEALALKILNGE